MIELAVVEWSYMATLAAGALIGVVVTVVTVGLLAPTAEELHTRLCHYPHGEPVGDPYKAHWQTPLDMLTGHDSGPHTGPTRGPTHQGPARRPYEAPTLEELDEETAVRIIRDP